MLPCTDLCVQHIRFATADIGYAFGSSVFFTTTNGGQTWTRESGGADALESLNGNVIRLVSDHGGCPGPCNLRVERAPIGSEEWKSGTLDRQAIDAAVVTLVRTGSRAFVETTSGPAGSLYRVMLYVSSDNGLSWSKRTDPCETVGAAAAGVPLASNSLAAAGGAVSIVCAGGGANQTKQVVITSADTGATYRSSKVLHLDCCGPGELGAASATVLVAVSTHLWRSIDGGESWLAVPGVKTGNSTVFVGFESPIVGRLVTESDLSPTKNTTIWSTTIWTTRDAGATWTSYAFS
jgi:hypothetical protein